MSTPVIAATPGTTVKEVAAVLASHGFTALPVVDGDRLVGIITEADVIRDRLPVDARNRHQDGDTVDRPGMLVADVMTSPVTAVSATADVVDVTTTMLDRGIRSMPVVDGYRVIGVVTRRDLVRVIGHDYQAITTDVRHLLSHEAPTVSGHEWISLTKEGKGHE
ncbi:MAG TPA: CBS domain-containing protein [Pseudonocardiaceae bacterium]|nr:CBS domain-containing protein [Pseudonocardiaceae bacterium]